MRGHLTEKADIFSFGVVALELVSGRPNSDSSLEGEKVYLLEWVCILPLFSILVNVNICGVYLNYTYIICEELQSKGTFSSRFWYCNRVQILAVKQGRRHLVYRATFK